MPSEMIPWDMHTGNLVNHGELGDDARGLGFEGLRIICVSQGGELSVDLRGYVKLHGGGN